MNMTRLYFFAIISILIIVPHMVSAFFIGSVRNISIIRNITCQSENNETLGSNFQLCAIRAYHVTTNGDGAPLFVYNGLRYANIFRNFIQRKCASWPKADGLIADTGSATCNRSLEFETYDYVMLCICATDNCNRDLPSCNSSAQQNNNDLSLIKLMPELTSPIECFNILDTAYVCEEHQWINRSSCQEYVKNNSVMCAITDNGTSRIRTSLIYENYEAYLDEKIYLARSPPAEVLRTTLIESDNNIYYNYSKNNIDSVTECACINPSSCNENTEICSRQTTVPTETIASSLTTDSSSVVSYTSAIATDTIALSTDASMATASTNSVIEIMSTVTTFANSVPTLTDSITTAANPTVTITSGGSTAAPASPPSTTVSSTTSEKTSITGETGLGRAATTGIACGIIFSALIFTAEIVFFKFFYSGNVASGPYSSFRYQA